MDKGVLKRQLKEIKNQCDPGHKTKLRSKYCKLQNIFESAIEREVLTTYQRDMKDQ